MDENQVLDDLTFGELTERTGVSYSQAVMMQKEGLLPEVLRESDLLFCERFVKAFYNKRIHGKFAMEIEVESRVQMLLFPGYDECEVAIWRYFTRRLKQLGATMRTADAALIVVRAFPHLTHDQIKKKAERVKSDIRNWRHHGCRGFLKDNVVDLLFAGFSVGKSE